MEIVRILQILKSYDSKLIRFSLHAKVSTIINRIAKLKLKMLTIRKLIFYLTIKYQNALTRGKILSFDINQVTSVINGYFSSLNFYLTALGQILILFY